MYIWYIKIIRDVVNLFLSEKDSLVQLKEEQKRILLQVYLCFGYSLSPTKKFLASISFGIADSIISFAKSTQELQVA